MTSLADRPLVVRCVDRMVFRVNRITYDAVECGTYDAYCFTDPHDDVDYISHAEWLQMLDEQRRNAQTA